VSASVSVCRSVSVSVSVSVSACRSVSMYVSVSVVCVVCMCVYTRGSPHICIRVRPTQTCMYAFV